MFICGRLRPNGSGEVCTLPPRHQRKTCSWDTGRLVRVPDTPTPGRCGKQKLEPPQAMIRCWFALGHTGRHSFQQQHAEERS